MPATFFVRIIYSEDRWRLKTVATSFSFLTEKQTVVVSQTITRNNFKDMGVLRNDRRHKLQALIKGMEFYFLYVKIVNYIIIIIQLDIDFSQGWSKFFLHSFNVTII